MKIRADFVTNSSSSSFTLILSFVLVDGTNVYFYAHGGTDETERIDYFDGKAIVKVSPKQLGNAKNIDELIKLLEDGVLDGWDETKIFAKSRPVQSYEFIGYCDEDDENEDECGDGLVVIDAYDFVKKIREKITSMDQIEKIIISGDEYGHDYSEYYNRRYTYNLKTKKYTGSEDGCEFEKNGSSGGDLKFSDLDSCDIEYVELDDEE